MIARSRQRYPFFLIKELKTSICVRKFSLPHGWDLEQAISSITSTNNHRPPTASKSGSESTTSNTNLETKDTGLVLAANGNNQPPGVVWKLVKLPFSIILISGAIGLGIWAASGVLSYLLSMIGLNNSIRSGNTPLVSVSQSTSEAVDFVSSFERDYERIRPNIVVDGFIDALQRSRHE